jgi:prophage regulatory protein
MTALANSTIYRNMAAGTFPKPRVLSAGCVRWRLSAVKAWMDALPLAA